MGWYMRFDVQKMRTVCTCGHALSAISTHGTAWTIFCLRGRRKRREIEMREYPCKCPSGYVTPKLSAGTCEEHSPQFNQLVHASVRMHISKSWSHEYAEWRICSRVWLPVKIYQMSMSKCIWIRACGSSRIWFSSFFMWQRPWPCPHPCGHVYADLRMF